MHRVAILTKLVLGSLLLTSVAAAADKKDEGAKKPAKPKRAAAARPAIGVRIAGSATFIAGGRTNLSYIRNVRIQDELKLTPEQKDKIAKAFAEQRKKQQALSAELRGIEAAERRKKIVEFQRKVQKLAAETQKRIDEVLTEPQRTRLMGISIQLQGARALLTPQIGGKLKLSDDQKKKLQAAFAGTATRLRAVMMDLRAGKVDRADYRKKIDEVRAQIDKEALTVLTEDQRDEFDDLKGPKIDRAKLFPGRGAAFAPGIRVVPVPAGAIKPAGKRLVPKKAPAKKAIPADKGGDK